MKTNIHRNLGKFYAGTKLLLRHTDDEDRILLSAQDMDGNTLVDHELTRIEGQQLAAKLFEHEDRIQLREARHEPT